MVVVVDDGLATGSTARAACQVARRAGAARVVLAVPVAAADSLAGFDVADEVVTVATPQPFVAVGRFYRDFAPTTDDEVVPSSTPPPGVGTSPWPTTRTATSTWRSPSGG